MVATNRRGDHLLKRPAGMGGSIIDQIREIEGPQSEV
jgi:hypothetical protein